MKGILILVHNINSSKPSLLENKCKNFIKNDQVVSEKSLAQNL